MIPLVFIALIILLGQCGGSDAGTTATPARQTQTTQAAPTQAPTSSAPSSSAPATEAPTTKSADPTQEPDPESEYGNQPDDQVQFVKAVTTAQEKAENADNDLKRGSALSTRNKALCKVLPSSGKVEDWTGKIASLDANGEGKGVVEIEIAPDVHIATWNNAFFDVSDNTLIEPGKLFDRLLEMETGQVVTFSGKLVDAGDTCVNDSRLTLDGKLADPKFLFKFSDVKQA